MISDNEKFLAEEYISGNLSLEEEERFEEDLEENPLLKDYVIYLYSIVEKARNHFKEEYTEKFKNFEEQIALKKKKRNITIIIVCTILMLSLFTLWYFYRSNSNNPKEDENIVIPIDTFKSVTDTTNSTIEPTENRKEEAPKKNTSDILKSKPIAQNYVIPNADGSFTPIDEIENMIDIPSNTMGENKLLSPSKSDTIYIDKLEFLFEDKQDTLLLKVYTFATYDKGGITRKIVGNKFELKEIFKPDLYYWEIIKETINNKKIEGRGKFRVEKE